MGALLGFHVGIWGYATSYTAHAYIAHATVVQQVQKNNDLCGWMGVQVSPMTAAFAESLGMAEPYGAIFDRPGTAASGRACAGTRGTGATTPGSLTSLLIFVSG
jgi:hypothetical protein